MPDSLRFDRGLGYRASRLFGDKRIAHTHGSPERRNRRRAVFVFTDATQPPVSRRAGVSARGSL